jgi:hypothetical protein
MNWEEVGAIGQVLGSIAVFVTLGYLGIQISHARAEVRRSLSQGRLEIISNLLMTRATDERLTRIVAVADAAFGRQPVVSITEVSNRSGLTRDEASAVLDYQYVFWTYRLQVIPYADELPQGDRVAFDNAVRRAYGQPGVARFYYDNYLKVTAHPDAVRYIDNLLAQPG